MANVVLVVAAHSDDEALGCAGTMAKHIDSGDEVHVLFMTNGVGARENHYDQIELRSNAAERVMGVIGVKSMDNCDFPDNSMDTIPLIEIIKKVENKIVEVKPNIIYTHHIGDLNVDHQVTHKAVITACRPQPGAFVKEIYTFEVLSSTEWQSPHLFPFVPNVFVDITSFIHIKKAALEVYADEMRQEPHSRSITNAINLCSLRGNTVGLKYAESFMLMRNIS